MEDEHMKNAPWELSVVSELDLTSTELSKECLESVLLRIPGFTYLGLGYCEFFTDRVRFLFLNMINGMFLKHVFSCDWTLLSTSQMNCQGAIIVVIIS